MPKSHFEGSASGSKFTNSHLPPLTIGTIIRGIRRVSAILIPVLTRLIPVTAQKQKKETLPRASFFLLCPNINLLSQKENDNLFGEKRRKRASGKEAFQTENTQAFYPSHDTQNCYLCQFFNCFMYQFKKYCYLCIKIIYL